MSKNVVHSIYNLSKIFDTNIGVPVDRIKLHSTFTDLGCDELDIVELTLILEEKLQIEINDDAITEDMTIEQLFSFLHKKRPDTIFIIDPNEPSKMKEKYAVIKCLNANFDNDSYVKSFTRWHDTYDEAKVEAERLCRKEGLVFSIVKVISYCKICEAPIKWTEYCIN